MENLKKELTFKDTDNNLIKLDIEIKDNNFSISGDMGRSAGQILDSIKPLGKNQKRLIEIWRKYHLNYMKAGTEKQEEALKEWRKKNKIESYDYDKDVSYLKSINLYEDEGYKYGTSWLKRDLPTDFKKELEDLFLKIEEEEIKKKENLKGGSWEDIEDNKIIVLGQFLELSPKEAEEDIKEERENIYSYCGIDYFIGNEEEIRQEAIDYLTDDTYLYQSWVEQQIKEGNVSFIKNIDDWVEWVIDSDGYGSILNSWDGSEDTYNYENEDFYIIRR